MRELREAGFTLVEVMVSLFIFGLLAAAGVALLAFSVRAQAASGAKLDDVGALQRATTILATDAGQALDRPSRDTTGTVLPAFVGEHDAGSTPMLRLVRAGWSNLDGVPRPGIQKVEYRVANHALERVAYPQVDGAEPLPAAVLLDHVASAALRYRYAGAWSDRWDGAGGVALPQALELTVVRDDGTALVERAMVGTGYAPVGPGGTNG